MPQRIEIATGAVAAGAATSPAWLPTLSDILGMATHPFWGAILAPLGVIWLLIQIGFFLYDRWKRGRDEGKQELK